MAENKGNQYYKVDIIADLFGVSVRRIQQLTQDGVISTTETSEGRRYDLVPTIQKYVKYLSDKAYGKSRSEAEIALKESQGELHKIRTEIAAGKYVSVEEVKLDYSRFFISFKKFALSIPSKLAGRLTGFIDPVEVRQCEKELQEEIQRLLRSFVVSAVSSEDVEETRVAKTKKKNKGN